MFYPNLKPKSIDNDIDSCIWWNLPLIPVNPLYQLPSVPVNSIHTDFYSKSIQRGHHYEITQPISPGRPNAAHECFSRNVKLSSLDCIYGTLRNPRSTCLEKWRFKIESLSLTCSACNSDQNAPVSQTNIIYYRVTDLTRYQNIFTRQWKYAFILIDCSTNLVFYR